MSDRRIHYCSISDETTIPCLCVRGIDHNENEFNIPIEERKTKVEWFQSLDLQAAADVIEHSITDTPLELAEWVIAAALGEKRVTNE